MIISLKLGSIDISFGELIKGLLSGSNEGNIGIIKDLRMPRVIIAALVGGNLALAGVLLQAVIRNPLADPQVTGISSGACLVSLIFIIFMPLPIVNICDNPPKRAFIAAPARTILIVSNSFL